MERHKKLLLQSNFLIDNQLQDGESINDSTWPPFCQRSGIVFEFWPFDESFEKDDVVFFGQRHESERRLEW